MPKPAVLPLQFGGIANDGADPRSLEQLARELELRRQVLLLRLVIHNRDRA